MKQIFKNNSDYEIMTPNGWEDFEGIFKTENANKETVILYTDELDPIEVTNKHQLIKNGVKIRAENIIVGDLLETKHGEVEIIDIVKSFQQHTFEIFNVDNDDHIFYVFDFKSKNCDEAAFIPNDVEFYESTYPVITSGKDSRVIMTSTPKGQRGLFYKIYTDAENGNNDYVPTKVVWSQVPGRDEEWKATTIRNTSEAQFSQEHDGNFMGSQHTLIKSSILQTMVYIEPIEEIDEDIKIYKEVVEGRKYVTTVDSSEGLELDSSAFSIIDVTEIPYEIVMTYRSNKISPSLYPSIIYNSSMKYNTSLVLLELNSIGQLVGNILHEELEYPNILMTSQNKQRQVVGGLKPRPGLKTTKATKSIGCSSLKTMIENDKLIVNDLETISELGTFVIKGSSYEADTGCNDDTVATLFLFGWLTSQTYFKDYTETDMRLSLINNSEMIEESITPFGFIDDGVNNDNVFVDDFGEIWRSDNENVTF